MEVNIFNILDLLGTAAFAISGALAAMNRKLDLFGIFIIAFVTAIGGGTLRDVLIGHTPVSWMRDMIYFYLIGGITLGAIIFRNKLFYLKRSLFLFDTIGLGVFTIIGVEIGVAAHLHPMISVTIGVMSASFGGVIRDILCNEIPVIFRKEIYATACLLGAATYLLLDYFKLDQNFIYIITASIVISVRLLVVKYKIALPFFYLNDQASKKSS